MSKVGLNTNIYQITGKYLGLINDFIVAAKVSPNKIDDKKRKDIIELFSNLNDSANKDPQIQLLSIIIQRDLRRHSKASKSFIKKIIDDLEKMPSKESIEKLEYIASTLDVENSGAFSKIKGE
jgi:hypothetical protein